MAIAIIVAGMTPMSGTLIRDCTLGPSPGCNPSYRRDYDRIRAECTLENLDDIKARNNCVEEEEEKNPLIRENERREWQLFGLLLPSLAAFFLALWAACRITKNEEKQPPKKD
ncbi:MAG: hypothetical protein AB1657_04000 [Candidatus Micrarchaeota archaeon]